MWNHPTEEQFAKILDYENIRWEYEPHEIILAEKDGQTITAFRPDFWLPDENFYIEITMARNQNKKNQKMALLKECYPNIKVLLITKKPLKAILQKYNFLWERV